MRRVLHDLERISSRTMLDVLDDARPGIRRSHSTSNLSTRSRRLRTIAALGIVALLVAFIPPRWGLRVAIVFALVVLGACWILLTVVGFAWDFYWPPKQHSPR